MQIGSTISWRDYEGLADGSGGAHSGEMLQNLKKALTAGSSINAPAAAPGHRGGCRVRGFFPQRRLEGGRAGGRPPILYVCGAGGRGTEA